MEQTGNKAVSKLYSGRLNAKRYILTMLLAVLLLNCFSHSASAYPSGKIYGYASYASEAPVIDGTADAIWTTTDAYFTYVNYESGQAYAAFKILWDESNLYFYAKVYDNTISCCRNNSTTNGINFWVSETNSNSDSYMNYPGDWHIFCNQNAAGYYYTGNPSITEVSHCATAIYDDYYIVECAVPVQTTGLTLKAGHIIGFDVSVDDDFNGDNVRDAYCTWLYFGDYWDNTKALVNVLLEGDYEDDEPKPENPTEPATNPPEDVTPETEPSTEPDNQATANPFMEFLLALWNFILKLFGLA